jgi:serine/threonine-protein kinase HipA
VTQATGTAAGKKYESDGGPGIRGVLELLQGAIQPLENRLHFLRSQFVFWLLGAIDGHGKNFSLALLPGADYRLTPLYDVLCAYPAVEANELHEKDLAMAMALEGRNRHYKWLEIQPRHWIETAARSGLTRPRVEEALDDVMEQVPKVFAQIQADVQAVSAIVGVPIVDRKAMAAKRFQRQR